MSDEETEAHPSQRLVDQRIRNRIIAAIKVLVDGDECVRRVGPSEYFEAFYDWVPHHADGGFRPNDAISPEEKTAILAVSAILDEACDGTPKIMTDDELIGTGWLRCVRAVARPALDLMLARGRFSEDREESEPSIR